MIIIINANVNTIEIDGDTSGCYYPTRLSEILKEIFDKLIKEDELEQSWSVTLELIKENKRKLIGEW